MLSHGWDYFGAKFMATSAVGVVAVAVFRVAFLLAQGGAELPSDISNWTATGILGLVLFWVFTKHIPDKDKIVTDSHTRFENTIREVMNHCRDESNATRSEWTRQTDRIVEEIRENR